MRTTMLPRVLEPEVMDTAEEAADYDAMDHGAVNRRFCEDALAQGTVGPSVLDVGTGTALIPIELCRLASNVRVTAIDLAEHMLAAARRNVENAGLGDRITVAWVDSKRLPYEDSAFATTISNSLIHHIPEPLSVFAELQRVTAVGGLVFVRDLARPASQGEVDHLVALYGGSPPSDPAARASFERQRELLRASLHAALDLDEVRALANAAGMERAAIRLTSDRHWTLSFRKS